MHAFKWVKPTKARGGFKGKLETSPVEEAPQKEVTKAFESYLLKKGMELIKSYPITLKVN